MTLIRKSKKYQEILENFLFNIQSIKSFTTYVEPVLKKMNDDHDKNNTFLNAINLIATSKNDPDPGTITEIKVVEQRLAEEFGIFIATENDDKYSVTIKNTSHLGELFVKEVKQNKLINNQLPILYQSSLITLVMYFELLIANIIRKRIYDYPESVKIDEKPLTLIDIRKFGSMEIAENYLIEKEVGKLIRESYMVWVEYFKKNFKCKFDLISILDDSVIEIIQRRNIIVHNDGVINGIYLSNVPKTSYKSDDKVVIAIEYILEAIRIIEKCGLFMGIEIWQRVEKNSIDRATFLEQTGFEYLKKEEWENALNIYELLEKETEITNKLKTIAQLNILLCKKRIEGIDNIKEELFKIDFSDKSNVFILILHALKEDYDMFFKLLPDVYKNGITLFHLQKWPILKEIREHEKYKIFLEENTNKNDIIGLEANYTSDAVEE